MKKNKREIVVVLDRSGSMDRIASDMEAGLNRFINDQKELDGECLLTLVQFDDRYEVVHDALPIKKFKNFKLVPRSMTALYDALGKTINTVGDRLANTPEEERPEKIVFVSVTDGLENASGEFNAEQVKDMIKHQENKYNWKFVYLGANQDAFAEGQKFGMRAGTTMNYAATSEGIKRAYDAISKNTVTYFAGDSDSLDFDEKQREEALK